MYQTKNKFTNLALAGLFAAGLCIAPGAYAQNNNNLDNTTQYVQVEEQKSERRIALENFTIADVASVRTKTPFEEVLANLGTTADEIIYGMVGVKDGTLLNEIEDELVSDLRKDIDKKIGAFDFYTGGNKLYLIKKLCYPNEELASYTKVIDTSSTSEFETIFIACDSRDEIGFRSDIPGLEHYLLWADSKDEAIEKSKDSKMVCLFSSDPFEDIDTPSEIKEFDRRCTEFIKYQDTNLLKPYFDVVEYYLAALDMWRGVNKFLEELPNLLEELEKGLE